MATPTSEQLADWVFACTSRGINLTTWEIEFVESMELRIEQYGDRVRFSDNEAEKIEQIYTDRVP